MRFTRPGLSDGDYAPTTQHRAVLPLLEQQVQTARAQYGQAIGQDLARFNTMLRERSIPNVIAR